MEILSDVCKAFFEVGDNVVNVFGAYGKANRRGRDTRSKQFFFGHLRVSCRRGMNHQRFNVGDVRKQRENFQIVDKFLRGLSSALNLERENRNAAVGEIFFVEGVVWVIFKRRVIDFADFGIFGEEVDNFQRVLDVAFNAERQSFSALQEQECIERRNSGAGISQQNRADVRNESRRAERLVKADAVIAGYFF